MFTFTFILLIILALLIGGAIVVHKNGLHRKTSYGSVHLSRGVYAWIWAGILAFVYFLASSITAGVFYYKAANVENSVYVVEELQRQRDGIAATFDDILANDQYVQLIEAATPEDIQFLRTNPQVSDFLLGRADRIVSINRRLFAERRTILDQSKSVCNFKSNPLIPQIPFLAPDCKLGELQDIMDDNPTGDS